jgi:hypothetical protein
MNVTNSPGRPPLSPQEGWLSDGRQVLNCADELATIGPVPVRVQLAGAFLLRGGRYPVAPDSPPLARGLHVPIACSAAGQVLANAVSLPARMVVAYFSSTSLGSFQSPFSTSALGP